jgi:thioredoxin-like negative regulator of GroEL
MVTDPVMHRFAKVLAAALVLAAGCDQGAKHKAASAGSASLESAGSAKAPPPSTFAWLTDETQAFTQARASGKAVIVDFYAAWATPCAELDRLLAEPDIAAALAPHFVGLRFDITDDASEAAKTAARYQASTVPFLRLIDTDGTVLATITSLPSAEELRATIEKAIAQRKPGAAGSAAARPITACPVPDQAQLTTAIHAQHAAIATCVEQAASRSGASAVPSRVDATFEIDERGSTVSASVSAQSAIDHKLETCLVDMLLDVKLAARNCPGTVTIRYPLVLDVVGE